MKGTTTSPRETTTPEVMVPATPAPRTPSVDEVIEAMRSDAATRPGEYLDEVQVPHGGE